MHILQPKKTLIVFLLLLFLISSNPAFAWTVVDSESVTISANVGGIIIEPPSGGGTGGTVTIPKTAVRFSGEAYPDATVFVWKDGVEKIKIEADDRGIFSATLEETYDSNALYTLYAVDKAGEKSLLINYPLVIYEGYVTHVSGVRFAPTVTADKIEVKAGDFLTLLGSALPKRNLEVLINGASEKKFILSSDDSGGYKIILPLAGFIEGDYLVHVKYATDTRISKLVQFKIGSQNILNIKSISNIPGDCNKDRVINLIDFSVLAFWYKRPNPPMCVDTNSDGIVNLIDFSILAFYWTG